jgi:hypothetical protein
VIFVLFGFLIKFVVLYFFLGSQIPISLFLLLANPLSALVISFCLRKYGLSKTKAIFVCILDTFVPLFGFPALVIFLFLGPIFKRIYQDEELDVYKIPLGEEQFNTYTSEKRALIERKTDEEREADLFDSFQIQPYLDIFEGDDLGLKVNAIEKLSSMGNARSVALLKLALNMADYEVRYFSNNALEALDKQILSQIEVATEDVLNRPEDFNGYNVRASYYLDAYLLGILDKTAEKFFLEKSLFDFLTSLSLSLRPEQSYLYVKITQIYLKLEKYQELEDLAKIALKTNLNDDDKAKVHFYLAESKFIRGDFQGVLQECEKASLYPVKFNLINESINWWRGDEAV